MASDDKNVFCCLRTRQRKRVGLSQQQLNYLMVIRIVISWAVKSCSLAKGFGMPNPFVSLIFLWLPISSISNQKTPIGPFGWTGSQSHQSRIKRPPLAHLDGPSHPLTSLIFPWQKWEERKRDQFFLFLFFSIVKAHLRFFEMIKLSFKKNLSKLRAMLFEWKKRMATGMSVTPHLRPHIHHGSEIRFSFFLSFVSPPHDGPFFSIVSTVPPTRLLLFCDGCCIVIDHWKKMEPKIREQSQFSHLSPTTWDQSLANQQTRVDYFPKQVPRDQWLGWFLILRTDCFF